MERLLTLFFIFILAYGCKGQESSASRDLASTGGCLTGKWPESSLPLQISLSRGITTNSGEITDLQDTAMAWHNSAGSTNGLVRPTFSMVDNLEYGDPRSYKDGTIGIYKSANWFASITSRPLAITQYYGYIKESAQLGKYVELTHADIILNYKDYGDNFKFNNGGFDVPTIVLHEFGHLFGLCHTEARVVKNSVMEPSYSFQVRTLYTFDVDLISELYGNKVIGQGVEPSLAADSLKKKAVSTKHQVGDEIRAVVELQADGLCQHFINDEKIFEHQVDLHKKHK